MSSIWLPSAYSDRCWRILGTLDEQPMCQIIDLHHLLSITWQSHWELVVYKLGRSGGHLEGYHTERYWNLPTSPKEHSQWHSTEHLSNQSNQLQLHASGKFTEIWTDQSVSLRCAWSCKAIIFFRNQILKIGLEMHYSPAPKKGFFSTGLISYAYFESDLEKMLQVLCKHSTFLLLHAPFLDF